MNALLHRKKRYTRVTHLIHNALLLKELDIPIEKVSAARNGNLSSG